MRRVCRALPPLPEYWRARNRLEGKREFSRSAHGAKVRFGRASLIYRASRAWHRRSDMTLPLDVLADPLDELANAFPPRRRPVPQPDGSGSAGSRQIMGFFTDATLCIGCKACEVAC